MYRFTRLMLKQNRKIRCKISTLKNRTQPGSFIKCNGFFTSTALVSFWRANCKRPFLLSYFPQFAEIPCETAAAQGSWEMRFSQGKGWGGQSRLCQPPCQGQTTRQVPRLLQQGGGWSWSPAPKKQQKEQHE